MNSNSRTLCSESLKQFEPDSKTNETKPQAEPPTEPSEKGVVLNEKDAIQVVMVGDTGVGKSSIIKLLTGLDSVKVSDSAKSCTKKITQYRQFVAESGQLNLVVLWDTIGCKDTEGTMSDEKVLNDIPRKIYETNCNRVRFVWIVNPSIRMTPDLQTQAKFIQKFQPKPPRVNSAEETKEQDTSDTDRNVWKSVLLIVKEPQPGPLQDAVSALISSLEEYGCPSGEHWVEGMNLLGFTNMDWKKHGHHYRDLPAPTRKNFHYYDSSQIREMLMDRIILSNSNASIPAVNIFYRNDYQCTKCGVIGDPSFVNDVNCHTIKHHNHPKGIIIKHKAEIEENSIRRHGQGLIRIHPGSLITRHHPGKKVRCHPGYWKNWNDKLNQLERDHNIVVFVSLGMLHTYSVGLSSATPIYCHTCGRNRWTGRGCLSHWNCCWTGSIYGCKKYSGQDIKYCCCQRPENSPGCKAYYECCPDGDEKTPGCITVCAACDQQVQGTRGCRFYRPCCKKHSDSLAEIQGLEGCKAVCLACRRDWKTPGCQPTTTEGAGHDMRRINRD